MRRFRFFIWSRKRGRKKMQYMWSQPSRFRPKKNFSTGLAGLERFLIRGVALAAVLLVLVQMGMGLAKDPVDYYLSVAQSLEAPSLESTPVSGTVTPNLIQEGLPQTAEITLRAIPAAPIKVIQNGKVLGTLARGELKVSVQTGILQLDGTNVPSLVRVQVTKKDAALMDPKLNQTYIVEHNIQTLRVGR